MSNFFNSKCLSPNPNHSEFCYNWGNKLFLVERYWIKSIIGEGNFCRTFLAVDEFQKSQPLCVIKQFILPYQKNEFAQEAEKLKLLGRHPQIPKTYTYFTVDSRQYLVQEFIQGKTLKQELNNYGVFNEAQIRELLIDLLSLLQFVHSYDVIHQDIKPENIIRRETDKKLVLVDFGVSNIIPKVQRNTVTLTITGSAEYSASEKSIGKSHLASDLYSLGVVCLHLLTNIRPLNLYDVMEMEWVWRDSLNGNFVSDKLGKVLDGLVEPKLRKRYQNVQSVFDDLQPDISTVQKKSLLTKKSVSTNVNSSHIYTFPPQSQTSFSHTKKNQRLPQYSASNDVPLVSAREINYENLRELLATGKWKEADEETIKCMLKVTKREKELWLRVKDINNFPCEDLLSIDKLWLKYSDGQFGFSVQTQIYQSLGGTRKYDSKIWEAFADQVGWRRKGRWLGYSQLSFNLKICGYIGHLPAAVALNKWSRFGIGYLFYHTNICRL